MANESSSNGGVDSQEVAELKKTIEMLTAPMQTVTGALQQLTEHSQGSLAFAANPSGAFTPSSNHPR
jgi:hypothetical protein